MSQQEWEKTVTFECIYASYDFDSSDGIHCYECTAYNDGKKAQAEETARHYEAEIERLNYELDKSKFHEKFQSDCVDDLKQQVGEAIKLAKSILDIAEHGNYENGNTPDQGYPDEGQVIADRALKSLSDVLEALKQKWSTK